MNKFRFILLAASLIFALTFTFSCSSDGDGDADGGQNGSNSNGNTNESGTDPNHSGETFTEVYAIEKISAGTFSYTYYYDYECKSDGTLEKYENDINANYLINGAANETILTIQWGNSDIIYHFNGTSIGLIGTWTRNRDKSAYCHSEDSKDGISKECDKYYDVTKAVFTQNNVSITRDFCMTEHFFRGSEGWTMKIIDCNNAEGKKGNEVVKYNLKRNGNSFKETYIYNGKSCEGLCRWCSHYSVSDMQNACEKAAEESASYYEILYGSNDVDLEKFKKCLKDNNFPNINGVFSWGEDKDDGGDDKPPGDEY